MAINLKWREVTLPALDQALSSGQTCYVPPELRPSWARALSSVTGSWLYYSGGALRTSTSSLSTTDAQARMDVERFDPSNPALLKYDRYLFIKMIDGRVFQMGPFKDVDYGHHLDKRPNWTAQYSSASTQL